MTVKALAELEFFKSVAMPEPEREISGVYVGDLLSWVMGRAESGQAWITIMSNINIVAVASLADTACIIVAELVELDGEVTKAAEERGINIISSSLPVYETALCLGRIL